MEKAQEFSKTLSPIFVCEKWERIRKEECKTENVQERSQFFHKALSRHFV